MLSSISLNRRNFGNKIENYDIEVFVPDGLADKYKNLTPLSLESWKIYEYKLDDEEIKVVEEELDNGYWSKLEQEDKYFFIRDYFYPQKSNKKWQKDFQLSDEVYVSSYAGYQKPYHYSETSIWGKRRKQYLMNHQKALFTIYSMNNTLHTHLADINEQADDMFFRLVNDMAKADGITEQLKAEDQMLWVQRMNNVRNRAEGIVNKELIYV